MSDEFLKYQEYFERLKNIYMSALSSFYTYEALRELSAPNIVGDEEAEVNIKTMNHFKGLFSPARRALNFHFLMELAKLFKYADKSLYIRRLINFAKSHQRKMTVKDFKDANEDREFIKDLTDRYNGLEQSDFEEIEKMLEENDEIIKKLTLYRDENLAHEDKNKTEISLPVEEIQKLFEIVAKILNLLSSKINFSTTVYDYLKEDCERDTKSAVDYLHRFEKYRMQEIRESRIGD